MAVLPASTDILIVGAGPTGLALANALRHLGLDPLLIDRQAEGANTSRAAVVHARTLEVLEPLGISPKLLANGIKVPLFSVRDGKRTLAEVSQRGVAPGVAKVRDTVWSSRFRIHHRVAATPRAAGLLLCGDAAHVHSPAGGQGMNTGIQDAVSLAGPLASALRGDAGALDEWALARHRVAERVVDLTDKMTKVAALSSVTARRVRNIALTLVGHIPAAREAIARRLSELDNR